ncbi:DNA polymerase-1 [Microlunatus sagamiharensis]|uniref:DNA-directed DNA polymerase n=1 Tax=Microlunatus sagamiharensis TaxID=546874 RepID=A0A1H2M0Y8_9ACTN|nr:bifunctional 3'-5' exonuclease/DNA polymerase [Microlunatus sagamiharensis]SDU86186.1 DNA polymerase-1 [Microlunatus sagamiharensis]
MDVALAPAGEDVEVAVLDDEGRPAGLTRVGRSGLAEHVARLEERSPRWVWADTAAVHPLLLAHGVRVARCHDLRMSHAVLARSAYVRGLASAGDARWAAREAVPEESEPTLLDVGAAEPEVDLVDVVAEHRAQQDAVAGSLHPARLRLLLAAESAGALAGVELTHVGLPFDAAEHERLLARLLGARPLPGQRPPALEALAVQVREVLEAPALNPDSGPDLLQALRRAGLDVSSTRQWELARVEHPVVGPLLEYKKLARLHGANGWSWLSAWVADGRFRPGYIPSGVVTGRWAARGGGALQLPKQVRAAVVAEEGSVLVVADAAQLEPRVLAAVARDEAMAAASRRGDLYQALVDDRVVDTRAHAKVAMLGALYGATSGESGRLLPRLQRSYPAATAYVEAAARAGEAGEVVTTWLGRSSPTPPEAWAEAQQWAAQPEADPDDRRTARTQAREWGRFTRNFVVQGTAAEWALCWLADLRRSLVVLGEVDGRAARLVYFLHDEVIVEAPAALSGAVEDAVRASAARAGRLLFGSFPVDFALDVRTVVRYSDAG